MFGNNAKEIAKQMEKVNKSALKQADFANKEAQAVIGFGEFLAFMDGQIPQVSYVAKVALKEFFKAKKIDALKTGVALTIFLPLMWFASGFVVNAILSLIFFGGVYIYTIWYLVKSITSKDYFNSFLKRANIQATQSLYESFCTNILDITAKGNEYSYK